jgi:hypothetical protein
MKAYSPDLRAKILAQVDAGMSKSEAARVFGVSRASIKRYAAVRRDQGTLDPKPPGCPPSSIEWLWGNPMEGAVPGTELHHAIEIVLIQRLQVTGRESTCVLRSHRSHPPLIFLGQSVCALDDASDLPALDAGIRAASDGGDSTVQGSFPAM